MDYQYMSEDALRDLDDIWDYVSQDSYEAADRVVERIYEAVIMLADMPSMGHTREDLTDRSFRFWPVMSYMIIYTTDADPIQVARIVSGARNLKDLLK